MPTLQERFNAEFAEKKKRKKKRKIQRRVRGETRRAAEKKKRKEKESELLIEKEEAVLTPFLPLPSFLSAVLRVSPRTLR